MSLATRPARRLVRLGDWCGPRVPHDLSATASANASALRRRADSLRSDTTTQKFYARVRSSHAATNVGASKIVAFEELHSVAPGRVLVAHCMGGDPTSADVEAGFAARQGVYYASRLAFEDTWVEGRRAVYAALILGGLGLPAYGDYTLVLDPTRTGSAHGCFPGNSATQYWSEEGFDERRCLDDAAPWDERASLLVVKHGHGLPGDPGRWAALVCAADDFSELVHLGALPLGAIIEIRLPAAQYRSWVRWAPHVSDGNLSAEQRTGVEVLALLHRWSERLEVPIVVV